MKTVLSIAGADPSGGAGIHADLKTFTAHGVYGMAVITAVTAQNTLGVSAVECVSPGMVRAQLEAVFTDIMPDAVKIGMIPDGRTATIIAGALARFSPPHIVVDTVMVSSSGFSLLAAEAKEIILKEIFPLAELLTPNVPEASALAGIPVRTRADMERAAKIIRARCGSSVLVKGGHLADSCDDFLLSGAGSRWFQGTRVETKNSHGTGCTLSSAIAANLAEEMSLDEAIEKAKGYLTAAISAGLCLGNGNGPLDHCWEINARHKA
jgi:hydroxymethylpyrimidine/phosphomethylpyrimidine kinase